MGLYSLEEDRNMIYVDQLGYAPHSKKTAVLAGSSASLPEEEKYIRVLDEKGDCVYEGKAVYFGYDEASGDYIWQADFSEVSTPGTYRIESGQEQSSCYFQIGSDLYSHLNQVLCKSFYYQRCGMKLEEKYAGIFKRKCCHDKGAVLLEDYSRWQSGGQDVKLLDVTGGWHDAGDYGRYTTAAATALAHLLYAWSFYSDSFKTNLNIPESGNGMDDILNECLYELKWLLKMQMPDGSVHHKLTSMRHANFVMPCEDVRQMILFPASTVATGDFAGIMAKASRVYHRLDADFADTALKAAKRAWDWLEQHPEFIGFKNPEECNTGEYGDRKDTDERMWAAVELFRCTGDLAYLEKAVFLMQDIGEKSGLGWRDVAAFAGWAILENQLEAMAEERPDAVIDKQEEQFRQQYRDIFIEEAFRLAEVSGQCGYMAAMTKEEYHWGSNSVPLNRGMLFATAYLLSGEETFLECAAHQLHYILGVNAVGYSYITGIGEHACRNLHNRVTVADGIDETIPGFVAGGANGHPADEKAEWMIAPGTPPMKCYLDIWECYSLN
ncbi:MAG: glycoside hydrolase family 9 protein, partial [Lachnospiraceae bacterium]|nr:glycoside hydrolase family 9 protein [Lachnospiraceae bacterium]